MRATGYVAAYADATFSVPAVLIRVPSAGVDVIPPVIPVFGWADDLAVWAALLYFMGDDLDAHISAPAGYRTGKYNYNAEDVHEADFTVVEGEEEEKDDRS